MRANEIVVWVLNDKTIDEIIEAHTNYVTKPTYRDIWHKSDDSTPYGVSGSTIEYVIEKEGKSAPRKAVLYPKYVALINTIITRCMANKEGSTHLYYNGMKDIVGKCYGDMLHSLENLGIIHLSEYYKIGEMSRIITLTDWSISEVKCNNIKVIDYIKKIESIKYEKPTIKETKFIKQYNDCLKELRLVDKDGALKWIKENLNENEHRYHYYRFMIDNFSNNGIYSIDRNGRIYHYLTSLPKMLKPFFNIKYQLDIGNSHPLLLSYFLINFFNIDIIIINILYSIYLPINYHNVGTQLCNTLKDNGFENTIKGIPMDVIEYIFMTIKGVFWDDFMYRTNTKDRGEMKEHFFRDVLYSHSTTTRHRPLAMLFKKLYPNVWNIVKDLKIENGDNLPNKMMHIEASIFKNILSRCFDEGLCVVNIHDALIVIDCECNEMMDINHVKDIIIEEYAKYSLIPTLGIDKYRL